MVQDAPGARFSYVTGGTTRLLHPNPSNPTYQGDSAARRHLEADIVEHESLGPVAEGHMLELDGSAPHQQLGRAHSVAHVRVHAHQVEHVLHVHEILLDCSVTDFMGLLDDSTDVALSNA